MADVDGRVTRVPEALSPQPCRMRLRSLPEWRSSEAVRRACTGRFRKRDVPDRGGAGEAQRELDERLRRSVRRRRDNDRGGLLRDRCATVRPAEARMLLRRRALMVEPIVDPGEGGYARDRDQQQHSDGACADTAIGGGQEKARRYSSDHAAWSVGITIPPADGTTQFAASDARRRLPERGGLCRLGVSDVSRCGQPHQRFVGI